MALRFDDRFVVFSRSVRTSTVENSDGALRTRRRGSALSRVEAVESLLPDVGEADLLDALRLQYGMSPNLIAVLRAELRRRPNR